MQNNTKYQIIKIYDTHDSSRPILLWALEKASEHPILGFFNNIIFLIFTSCFLYWEQHMDLRERKWWEAWKDCTVRSFITCTLQTLGWSNQGDEQGGACSMHGRSEKCAQNLRGRDNSKDLGEIGLGQTGFILLTIWTSGRFLWTQWTWNSVTGEKFLT